MPVQEALDGLREAYSFATHVVAWDERPERPAQTAPFPPKLHLRLVDALAGRGIDSLYTHQADAIEAVLDGQHVVVTTATASGKTLCYNLPVLHAQIMTPKRAKALYLFPTKALAQDQTAALGELVAELGEKITVRTYDGDTPQGQRADIRKSADIVLSNPDMLHQGILPYHTRWATYFENLRYVVLDELHTYRGVFGSHVANVLRRLRRVCAFYGSNPIFICASATIANPKQLAEKLVEAPVVVVDNDGSPQGEKHIILYNPPLTDVSQGIRRSYTLEARRIAGEFLANDVQTIVFARARLTTELLLGYIRDEVASQGGEEARIRGYRGGYLPDERRAIERGLRAGEVRGVVATNALELGVDIGELSAAVIAGYPGTIASTWQQAGRAGRRAGLSAAVLVLSAAPLDQYLARNPRFLFDRSPEHALINPDNLVILLNHVRCAAFELPFEKGEAFGSFGEVQSLLDFLAEDEKSVHKSGERYQYISPDYPAERVSLRTGGSDTVIIQQPGFYSEDGPRVIGEIDRTTAPLLVYEGAIYTHEGQQYLIDSLDWAQGIAHARPTEADYYTKAGSESSVTVIEEFDSAMAGDVIRAHGIVNVTNKVSGYRIIRRYTHETLGHGEIHLPEQQFETRGYWFSLTPDLAAVMTAEGVIQLPNVYGPNWAKQRLAALERDAHMCRQCGRAQSKDAPLHVHHIQPFRTFGYIPGKNDAYKQANQLDNLLTVCPSCHRILEGNQRLQNGLSGLAEALRVLATLRLMCEPSDIGITVESKNAYTKAPTLTIYDSLPAGLGFSERLYELHDELLHEALELVQACPCEDGCPACVGPVGGKSLTVTLLEAMMEDQD